MMAPMMDREDLLVEIGAEELPPTSLKPLAVAFAEEIHRGLNDHGLNHGDHTWYATPRRLAVIVRDVIASQANRAVERRGPPIKAAYDEAGKPTKAAVSFARACGVSVSELGTLETGKGSWLSYKGIVEGESASRLIPDIINKALTRLPIAKRMRWGSGHVEFVRPVHWVVLLFGDEVIDAHILGKATGDETFGHRFHHPHAIKLHKSQDYIDALKSRGYVLADYIDRQALIRQLVMDAAKDCDGTARIDEGLLDEVTALVEWPVAISGSFSISFLSLPEEVLIATMQSQQKYFPVFSKDGKQLTANFIAISNIESRSPEQVRLGNERVLKPRLSDAAFFWQRDCRQPLESLRPQLHKVIFQQKLGTLRDKTERMKQLGAFIAERLKIDAGDVERAARLAKCDLLTAMVGEFPALQGVMGRYYAGRDGENEDIAGALDEQYMPRYAGAELPKSGVGQVLAIADRLDTIMGIFAIGQAPTGDKDPFALRRASLGCLRILIERQLPLDLQSCLKRSAESYDDRINAHAVIADVFDFMMERLRHYYTDNGIGADVFEAVLACRPGEPYDFNLRLQAVEEFKSLPGAANLSAANKRIRNILKQANYENGEAPDEGLFQEKAERELYQHMQAINAGAHIQRQDYVSMLTGLADLRDVVDSFFDEVLIMCDDETLKNNRLALLSALRELFLTTADISKLQG